MILIDTHVLLWLDAGSSDLGLHSRRALDAAVNDAGLSVSAITFWEVAMLVGKGRLELDIDVIEWRTELLSKGLIEIPVSGLIGLHAATLASFHGDPADRLIVATAMDGDLSLYTADRRILDWTGEVLRQDASH